MDVGAAVWDRCLEELFSVPAGPESPMQLGKPNSAADHSVLSFAEEQDSASEVVLR